MLCSSAPKKASDSGISNVRTFNAFRSPAVASRTRSRFVPQPVVLPPESEGQMVVRQNQANLSIPDNSIPADNRVAELRQNMIAMQTDNEITKRHLLSLNYMVRYSGNREITLKSSGETVYGPLM